MKKQNCMNYKGYIGSVEYSEEDGVLHGKVVGIRALISYEGKSVDEITKDFNNAVDEYLNFCAESGIEPEKPFKGSFNVRIGEDLHRKSAIAAQSHGMSLNSFVEEAIKKYHKSKSLRSR